MRSNIKKNKNNNRIFILSDNADTTHLYNKGYRIFNFLTYRFEDDYLFLRKTNNVFVERWYFMSPYKEALYYMCCDLHKNIIYEDKDYNDN